MSFGTYLVAALATLSSQAIASPHRGPFGISVGVEQFPAYAPDKTSTKCVSKWALTPGPANTNTEWATRHIPCTTTSTCTFTFTTTPADVTTTLISTCSETTTDSCSTATATETDTTTTTTTTTETETSTTCTITTTTCTSTSTIAAPAHFVAVQTSFPGSKYVKPRQAEFAEIAEELEERNAVQLIDLGISQNRYPQGVYCEEFHEQCSISYTTVTTTETATPCTSTTCTTVTSTSTITPWAVSVTMTTETDTDTITCSETTTETATLTITESSSTSVYAACATNNFANRGPDNGFFAGINGDATDGKLYEDVENAYDCCVSAITDPAANIQAFSFYPQLGVCLGFYREGKCPKIKPHDTVRRSTRNQGEIVGNGPCGAITGYSV